MDAEALKATLNHLATTMPVMASQVNEGIETGHAALNEGNELVAHGQQLVEAAEQQLQEAENAVHEFVSWVGEAKSNLEQVYQELEAKIHEFTDIDPVLDQVDQATHAVEDAFDHVKGVLTDGTHALNDASNVVNDHLETLFGAIDEGHQQLSNGIDQVNSAFETVQHTVQQGHDALVQHVSDLTDHVNTKANELTEHVTGFIGQGKDWMDDLAQNLGDTWPNMIQDHVNQALDDVRSKIHDEIQSLVRSAMDKVCEALDGFDEKLTNSQNQSALSRDVLKPVFDSLESVSKPVTDALDSIKDAASMVGISL